MMNDIWKNKHKPQLLIVLHYKGHIVVYENCEYLLRDVHALPIANWRVVGPSARAQAFYNVWSLAAKPCVAKVQQLDVSFVGFEVADMTIDEVAVNTWTSRAWMLKKDKEIVGRKWFKKPKYVLTYYSNDKLIWSHVYDIMISICTKI